MVNRELEAWYRRTTEEIEAAKARGERAARDAWTGVTSLPRKLGRAQAIADEASRRHLHQHNNGRDALRHAEWSKQMADELGAGFSRAVGLAHEVEGFIPSLERGKDAHWRDLRVPTYQLHVQPWSEAEMDMRNNAEGIAASIEGRPIDPRRLQNAPRRR